MTYFFMLYLLVLVWEFLDKFFDRPHFSVIASRIVVERNYVAIVWQRPQKCYPKDYIETLEQSELFAELKLKAAGRQAVMKAVADAKRSDNIAKFSARVNSVKIPALTEDELKLRTIKSKQRWYAYQSELRCEVDAVIDIEHLPANVLHRWEVNYIRHELTRYEKLLDQIRGLVGTRDIYMVIKGEILDKIATAYPWLKDECDRQKEVIL